MKSVSQWSAKHGDRNKPGRETIVAWSPRGTLVRRSRHLWRWLLTGLALVLIVLAVLWAWPHPLPRTMLLVLSGAREERTLPLVPFVEGDCSALLDWRKARRCQPVSGN